jgi:hypothetical protein
MLKWQFRPYPDDIKANGKKTGRIRRWLRRSGKLNQDRKMGRLWDRFLGNTPFFNFELEPRISLHKRRKQSRGFVSNRKSDDEGVRVEWNSLNDTKDK